MRIDTQQYRLAGQVLGSYRCLALLGEGGMGQVYLAEHVRLGRQVALKRLKETAAARPEAVAQFMSEAQAVNRIRHPHIVDVTDFVQDDDGVYYLMELLPGQTVAERTRDDGPLAPQLALHVAHQVADALEAAHAADVLHLDVKPSNIFLTEREGRDDYVKLLDFGIATLRGAAAEPETDSGVLSMPPVTPAYMAPEQVTPEPVDHRADLYSLGIVIYEMLAGEPPFEAPSTPGFVHKHLHVEPPPLARKEGLPHRIPPVLSRLVADCLHKSPADRPATAAELRDRIAEVAEQEYGVRLEPGRPPALSERPPARRRLGAVLGIAAAALVGLAVAVIAWTFVGREDLALSAEGPPVVALADRGLPAAGSVKLSLRSSPSGVEVLQVGAQERVLGETPLAVRLGRGEGVVQLRLRRSGYRSQEILVDTRRGDQQLLVALERRGGTPHAVAMQQREATSGRARTRRRPKARPRPRNVPEPREHETVMRRAVTDPSGTVDPFAQ